MLFANDEHYEFYMKKVTELNADCYLRALIYTLGMCDDTRQRWNLIYNENEKTIVPEQIHQGWQTGTSLRVTRLAFQLYTDGTPTAYLSDEEKGDINECQCYSVSDIFCCEFAPFFSEAIKIRYPEYFTNRGIDKL